MRRRELIHMEPNDCDYYRMQDKDKDNYNWMEGNRSILQLSNFKVIAIDIGELANVSIVICSYY